MAALRPLTSLMSRRFGTSSVRRSGFIDPSMNQHAPEGWPGMVRLFLLFIYECSFIIDFACSF
jgi:hypothetical protein